MATLSKLEQEMEQMATIRDGKVLKMVMRRWADKHGASGDHKVYADSLVYALKLGAATHDQLCLEALDLLYQRLVQTKNIKEFVQHVLAVFSGVTEIKLSDHVQNVLIQRLLSALELIPCTSRRYNPLIDLVEHDVSVAPLVVSVALQKQKVNEYLYSCLVLIFCRDEFSIYYHQILGMIRTDKTLYKRIRSMLRISLLFHHELSCDQVGPAEEKDILEYLECLGQHSSTSLNVSLLTTNHQEVPVCLIIFMLSIYLEGTPAELEDILSILMHYSKKTNSYQEYVCMLKTIPLLLYISTYSDKSEYIHTIVSNVLNSPCPSEDDSFLHLEVYSQFPNVLHSFMQMREFLLKFPDSNPLLSLLAFPSPDITIPRRIQPHHFPLVLYCINLRTTSPVQTAQLLHLLPTMLLEQPENYLIQQSLLDQIMNVVMHLPINLQVNLLAQCTVNVHSCKMEKHLRKIVKKLTSLLISLLSQANEFSAIYSVKTVVENIPDLGKSLLKEIQRLITDSRDDEVLTYALQCLGIMVSEDILDLNIIHQFLIKCMYKYELVVYMLVEWKPVMDDEHDKGLVQEFRDVLWTICKKTHDSGIVSACLSILGKWSLAFPEFFIDMLRKEKHEILELVDTFPQAKSDSIQLMASIILLDSKSSSSSPSPSDQDDTSQRMFKQSLGNLYNNTRPILKSCYSASVLLLLPTTSSNTSEALPKSTILEMLLYLQPNHKSHHWILLSIWEQALASLAQHSPLIDAQFFKEMQSSSVASSNILENNMLLLTIQFYRIKADRTNLLKLWESQCSEFYKYSSAPFSISSERFYTFTCLCREVMFINPEHFLQSLEILYLFAEMDQQDSSFIPLDCVFLCIGILLSHSSNTELAVVQLQSILQKYSQSTDSIINLCLGSNGLVHSLPRDTKDRILQSISDSSCHQAYVLRAFLDSENPVGNTENLWYKSTKLLQAGEDVPLQTWKQMLTSIKAVEDISERVLLLGRIAADLPSSLSEQLQESMSLCRFTPGLSSREKALVEWISSDSSQKLLSRTVTNSSILEHVIGKSSLEDYQKISVLKICTEHSQRLSSSLGEFISKSFDSILERDIDLSFIIDHLEPQQIEFILRSLYLKSANAPAENLCKTIAEFCRRHQKPAQPLIKVLKLEPIENRDTNTFMYLCQALSFEYGKLSICALVEPLPSKRLQNLWVKLQSSETSAIKETFPCLFGIHDCMRFLDPVRIVLIERLSSASQTHWWIYELLNLLVILDKDGNEEYSVYLLDVLKKACILHEYPWVSIHEVEEDLFPVAIARILTNSQYSTSSRDDILRILLQSKSDSILPVLTALSPHWKNIPSLPSNLITYLL